MRRHYSSNLVKSEDLNHHGTLFAARASSWFVEAGFMTAAGEHNDSAEVVCRNVHGMQFTSPVQNGDIIHFESMVARVGKSSVTIHVTASSEQTGDTGVEGFITFVTVDKYTGKKKIHEIVMDEAEDASEQAIRHKVNQLFADIKAEQLFANVKAERLLANI